MKTENYTVDLVGCASQKLRRPAPARELYVSQLFNKAAASAEQTCDRWYVLSAKHGLLHPDAILEPHDMKLGTNHRTSPPTTRGATGSGNSWPPSSRAWRTSRSLSWPGSSTGMPSTGAIGPTRFR
ncbi:hypothetical protein QF036_002551 [Arthrobacter globiformis]|nr:hypothetical protein [Arthrobacter globiformis]